MNFKARVNRVISIFISGLMILLVNSFFFSDWLSPQKVDAFTGSEVVISQVYGGGGHQFKNDFIELHNRGNTSFVLDRWLVRYTTAGGSSFETFFESDDNIPPGGFFLVQEAEGSTHLGPELPEPDAIGDMPISLTAGNVKLISMISGEVVDEVGWGETLVFEGSGPAPATDSTTAIQRKDYGNLDTNDNANDFVSLTPYPKNSSFRSYPLFPVPELPAGILLGTSLVGIGVFITIKKRKIQTRD
jgi:hypothetical protein